MRATTQLRQHLTLVLLLARVAGEEPPISETVDLVMVTERALAANAVIGSACARTLATLRVHVITPDDAVLTPEGLVDGCAEDAVRIRLLRQADFVGSITALGLSEEWYAKVPPTRLSVHPASWDQYGHYNSFMNVVRYYLPVLPEFQHLNAYILVDDDVVFRGDILNLWHHPQDNVPLSAGCMNWLWSKTCKAMEASWNATYADVPYFGLGVQRTQGQVVATCQPSRHTECAPPGFLTSVTRFVDSLDAEFSTTRPTSKVYSPEFYEATRAWNFGLNKVNLIAWRERKVTERFDRWFRENRRQGWFPTTSVAYGLGIAMLVLKDDVVCFDDQFPILHGLGFIQPDELRRHSIVPGTLGDDYFGLHWNGDRKPWDVDTAIDAYAPVFREDAPQLQQHVHRERQDRKEKLGENTTSFLILHQTKTGANWLMGALDAHPHVCATGDINGTGRGWPTDALIPKYPQQRENSQGGVCRPKDACKWGHVSRWLGMLLAQGDGDLPDSCRHAQGQDQELHAVKDYFLRDSSYVDEDFFFGPHLPATCRLLASALEKVRSTDFSSGQQRQMVISAAFHGFFTQLVHRHRTRLDDEATVPLFPCECGPQTRVAGARYTTSWLRDATHNRYLFETLADVGTKVIILDRFDIPSSHLSGSLSEMYQPTEVRCKQCRRTTRKTTTEPAVVDPVQLVALVRGTLDVRKKRDILLNGFGIDTLRLDYEACAADPTTCLTQTLDYLGVDSSKPIVNRIARTVRRLDQDRIPLRDKIKNYDDVVTAFHTAGLSDHLISFYDAAESSRP